MKRLFDIASSFAALAVFSPLLIPIAILLKLTGEHDIFYMQKRIGKGGKPFGLLKFATMLRNSPQIGSGNITLPNDPRVLPLGRFLRKTKINELPQLINVLKGDMSVIGPRPITANHFDYYGSDVKEIIGRMRPGLSGVGSIVFRNEEAMLHASNMPPAEFYRQHIAPYKGMLEVWYYKHKNLFLDLKLIALTILVVLNPSLDPHKYLPGLPAVPAELQRQGAEDQAAQVLQMPSNA